MGETVRMMELDLSVDAAASTNCPIIPSYDSQETKNEKISAYANGLALWLLAYHFPSKIRKSGTNGNIDNGRGIEARLSSVQGRIELVGPSPAFIPDEWVKSARLSLKKIKVEDLGYMNASELIGTIPETDDGEGRGLSDLHSIERKRLVKVIFDDVTGHVYLVGDAKKLEKKCFDLRNLLSHYYWRLSGKDVTFT
mmetsp:Transcript_5457/g.11962  ORF Transcript_5457/g.11962 Transcript_5457/m.11962 type:complete len:196 (+) Transcript_5457:201-788(+)